MARRGHAYPQVTVCAEDVVNMAVTAVARAASVEAALAAARGRQAAVLDVGGALVLQDDLQRASTLGLGGLEAVRLARPLRVVEPGQSEVTVRRLVAEGEAPIVVREGARTVGAIAGRSTDLEGPAMVGPLARALAAPARALLLRVGELAAAQGALAFLVGGVVRNAVAGQPAPGGDLDVVVEGDGLCVARRLADEIGGSVVEHARFLTASVQSPAAGRVDIATARAERYEAPGALPHVMPSGIVPDLGRRDFTVNAMAVELGSGSFLLLDPHGGRADVGRQVLRVLHPLSFVEDPTRMFRAARYGTRLGLRLDGWTAGCLALGLDLAPYQALSGQRIAAELERIVHEPTAPLAMEWLDAAGVLGLLDRRLRLGPGAGARLRALDAARQWAAGHGRPVSGLELLLLVILDGQDPGVADRALRRLGYTGEPRRRLAEALAESDGRTRRLAAAGRRSARAGVLRQSSALAVAWLWLRGDRALRAVLEETVGAAAAAAPWLRGQELMALGVPRGPALARLRDELRDARLDGSVVDRAGAVRLVRRRMREMGVAGAGGSTDKEG